MFCFQANLLLAEAMLAAGATLSSLALWLYIYIYTYIYIYCTYLLCNYIVVPIDGQMAAKAMSGRNYKDSKHQTQRASARERRDTVDPWSHMEARPGAGVIKCRTFPASLAFGSDRSPPLDKLFVSFGFG